MNLKDALRREKHVVIHGQSACFRIVKYAILIPLFAGLWQWAGWRTAAITFGGLALLGVIVHLFFRWKTKAWTQSWGPYERMELPNDA